MEKSRQIYIYDTTLRDGTQAEKISFSKADKIRIVQKLDRLGIPYIEGGWPASNPKDMDFFREIRHYSLSHAKISAFGSTRRSGQTAENDKNLLALLEAETPVTTIFGKSWMLHISEVLKVSPDENLAMIHESCRFLANHGKEVIFDAEHFFDGYKEHPDYALDVLKTAAEAGASTITLCDTNGGCLPDEIHAICKTVRQILPVNTGIGIHCHNDSELAVANSITAVQAGICQVQGTINGFGERCGNANLCSIIANLELKTDFVCLPHGHLSFLKDTGLFVEGLANIRHNHRLPFIGTSAFAHKGGMHVNAVVKNPKTFEHISPESVGNQRRILISDLSGKSNLNVKIRELGIDPDDERLDMDAFLNEIKNRENMGYEYEAADASFAVL